MVVVVVVVVSAASDGALDGPGVSSKVDEDSKGTVVSTSSYTISVKDCSASEVTVVCASGYNYKVLLF